MSTPFYIYLLSDKIVSARKKTDFRCGNEFRCKAYYGGLGGPGGSGGPSGSGNPGSNHSQSFPQPPGGIL